MNTILQLHSKVVTSVILITSIVGLLISIYDPLKLDGLTASPKPTFFVI